MSDIEMGSLVIFNNDNIYRNEVVTVGQFTSQFGLTGTNYCGPGYTGGKFVGPDERGNFTLRPTNVLDQACKIHDEAYANASGAPDEAAQILAADLKLLRACSQSSQPDECAREMNKRQEGLGEFVVARGDASQHQGSETQ